MANRLLLRDGESISQDMVQRILGSQFATLTGVSGVGTGFAAGGVGRMNNSWLGGANVPTGHMVVTATGTTMVLTIAPGWALLMRDLGGATYDPRAVLAECDASQTVTVSANATGSTRNDTVCLKVDMSTAPTSDGSNLVSAVILAGAGGGGLANAPADGNLYLPLANVAVANGAASISQGNVTDKRMSGVSDSTPYRARGVATAGTALTQNAFTKIALATADYDPNGNFSSSTYTAPCSGYYAVSYRSGAAASATGQRVVVTIYKNGVEISRGPDLTSSGANAVSGGASDQVKLLAGDTIDMRVFTSAAGLTSEGATAGTSYLSVQFQNPG